MTTYRPNAERSAAAYDALALAYDLQLGRGEEDLATREAFRSLVRALVPAGRCLLDFGCGTGSDAQWYAEQGYRVLAYDNSRGMMQQVRERCRLEIEKRQIVTLDGAYEDFLTRSALPDQPSAITANFAVLNLIEDLRRLFETFATHLSPGGLVIGCVLNPFLIRDARYGWWWRSLSALVLGGRFRLRGKQADTFRYTRQAIRAAARPRFRELGLPYARRLLSRYVFLAFGVQ